MSTKHSAVVKGINCFEHSICFPHRRLLVRCEFNHRETSIFFSVYLFLSFGRCVASLALRLYMRRENAKEDMKEPRIYNSTISMPKKLRIVQTIKRINKEGDYLFPCGCDEMRRRKDVKERKCEGRISFACHHACTVPPPQCHRSYAPSKDKKQ